MMKWYLSGVVSIAAALIMGACMHVELPHSVPLCGFETPGRSKNWDEHLRATYSKPNRSTVYWPTFVAGPTLEMDTFEEALDKVDKGKSSIIVLQNTSSKSQRLRLHSRMIPYVVRSFHGLRTSLFDAERIRTDAGGLVGDVKQMTKNYIHEYYGNSEKVGVPMQKFY